MSFSAVKAGEAFVELAVSGREQFEAWSEAPSKRLASRLKSKLSEGPLRTRR